MRELTPARRVAWGLKLWPQAGANFSVNESKIQVSASASLEWSRLDGLRPGEEPVPPLHFALGTHDVELIAGDDVETRAATCRYRGLLDRTCSREVKEQWLRRGISRAPG